MTKRGASPELVLFTATTGRTGSTSLVELFQRNVPGCVAEHEPGYQPETVYERLYEALFLRRVRKLDRRGFGRALQWYDRGERVLDRLVHLRARRIRRLGCRVYLESNHAFLSSLGDALVEEFPNLGLIHLVRDPMEVAVSHCNRNTRPAGSPDFLRALGAWHPHPEARRNCLVPPAGDLTCFQYYLWVWLECERRRLRFLERNPAVRCFRLLTPDLNEPARIAELFAFFGLPVDSGRLVVPPARNRNAEVTRVDERHREEARDLLRRLGPGVLAGLPATFGLADLL
ncbi:hypothetical protein EZJ19_05260 [Parasulfuritortus cantonensis]|uniref:Sulfotransferase n=1 Tax=Parasulfuritortus cantonensis TaxID=2528202 RepID=A0A4R1BGJ3_9PROT|nr:hypothetical protein [Parasulfuritortus cantonensis]TCJ16313.1 hypothetical protein EZJ19_05260 [Parasulfuritortus cantonensis]